MSGRTYYKKEVMRWGYVALVCIGLAFTSLTGATASTKSAELAPEKESKLGFCTATHPVGEISDKRACEVDTLSLSTEPANLLGSVFVNTNFNPYTGSSPILSPLRERHAD